MICVPLYETLGENAIEYIIDHSGTSVVLIAAKRLGRLTQAVPLLKKSSLRAVVYWGEPRQEELKVKQGPAGVGGGVNLGGPKQEELKVKQGPEQGGGGLGGA